MLSWAEPSNPSIAHILAILVLAQILAILVLAQILAILVFGPLTLTIVVLISCYQSLGGSVDPIFLVT